MLSEEAFSAFWPEAPHLHKWSLLCILQPSSPKVRESHKVAVGSRSLKVFGSWRGVSYRSGGAGPALHSLHARSSLRPRMGQFAALPSFWCKRRGSLLRGASQLLIAVSALRLASI